MSVSGLSIASDQDPVTPKYLRGSTLANFSSISLGDSVILPDGQQGILRYVGPVEGKTGEFAGVELIKEWASQGRHNGEFEGYCCNYLFL